MFLLMVNYVLKAAIRDRLVVSMFVLFALAISLSIFFGTSAVNEKDQFAAVFSAGSIRIMNVLGLCLFVVFFIRRSFESRDVEYMLTRPIGRISFLLSYSAGFSIMGAIAGIVSGIALYLLSPHLFSDGHVLWALSIVVENIIMVNAALFFAMVIASAPTAAFCTLGFYVLSRMMSQILGIIDSGKHITQFEGLEIAMQLVSFVMPRLDLLGQTSWLIYGASDGVSYGFVIAQGAVYSALILLAAMIDLVMRKF
jgi:hypothetical protein